MQVVVALLDPLQEGGRVMAAAVRVMECMIVDNRSVLTAQIKALPPIPKSVSALQRVIDAVEAERGRLGHAETVTLLLHSLGHHSLSVRAAALEEPPPPPPPPTCTSESSSSESKSAIDAARWSRCSPGWMLIYMQGPYPPGPSPPLPSTSPSQIYMPMLQKQDCGE